MSYNISSENLNNSREDDISESLLIDNFPALWIDLLVTYQYELSLLAFMEIPYEKEVFNFFEKLIEN